MYKDVRLVEGKSDNEDSWHEATGDPLFIASPAQGKICAVGRQSPKDEITITDERVGWTKASGEFVDKDRNKAGNRDSQGLVASKKFKEDQVLVLGSQDKPTIGLAKPANKLQELPKNVSVKDPGNDPKTSSNGKQPHTESNTSKKSSDGAVKGQIPDRRVVGETTADVRGKLPSGKQMAARTDSVTTRDLEVSSTKHPIEANHPQNNDDVVKRKTKQTDEKDAAKNTQAKIKESEKRPRPKSFPASMLQDPAPPKEKPSGKARPTSVVADDKTNQNEKGDGCVIS